MSKITAELLAKIAPRTPKAKRDRFLDDMNRVLPWYKITSELRVAAWLATVCIESDYFKVTEEYASGWAYDISKNRKKAIKLGNTEKGDGPKYKGRTGIQTTGKKNYRALTNRIGKRDGVDFVENPELLREPKYFVEGACVYWDDNRLNSYADRGKFFNIQGLVNKGSPDKRALGYDDRLKIYDIALRFLPDDFSLTGESAPTPDAPAPDNSRPLLKIGSRGQAVVDLQNLLGLSTDGIFDAYEDDAVRTFQQTSGLTVDGKVGPETWAALDKVQKDSATNSIQPSEQGEGQNTLHNPSDNSSPTEPGQSAETETVEKTEEVIPSGTTTEEKKETVFTADTIPQLVPKITSAKTWLGSLGIGGIFSSIAAKAAGMPDWLVFLLGVIAGMVLLGLVFIFWKHIGQVFELAKHAMDKNADKTQNNIQLFGDTERYREAVDARKEDPVKTVRIIQGPL